MEIVLVKFRLESHRPGKTLKNLNKVSRIIYCENNGLKNIIPRKDKSRIESDDSC